MAVVGLCCSKYVRVLIERGWANRSSGKAWDDSSRGGRTVVHGRTVSRARPVVQAKAPTTLFLHGKLQLLHNRLQKLDVWWEV